MSVTEMKQIFTDGVSLDKPLPMMLNSTEARILGCITGVGDIYTHRHFFPLVCLCVCVSLALYESMHVHQEDKGQLVGLDSLLPPRGYWG